MKEIYRFSIISGMKKKKKKNEKGGYDFQPEHYRYNGESFKINPQTHVLIVLCDNCNENHACHYKNCELVYDKKGQIQTIYLFNATLNEIIWIHHKQSIGDIYYKNTGLIYGNGELINDKQNLFTNITQNQQVYNDTQKVCIFSPTQRPLMNIHCNNKDRQILCKLEYEWTFFCVCKPLQENKFYFYSTSKYILFLYNLTIPI
jgi:hypothetical protein